ncbi:hypothetical protein CYFUS_005473 [Cystobacter fuscus]|uniref:Uncharacterized protein n=1 Tax=Cystobacter fuscus TaxID=43 RepID=A0A250J7Z5_9BACT|nr:hypothetical protein CYFUS_005473 [Cystobacter fuscus]
MARKRGLVSSDSGRGSSGGPYRDTKSSLNRNSHSAGPGSVEVRTSRNRRPSFLGKDSRKAASTARPSATRSCSSAGFSATGSKWSFSAPWDNALVRTTFGCTGVLEEISSGDVAHELVRTSHRATTARCQERVLMRRHHAWPRGLKPSRAEEPSPSSPGPGKIRVCPWNRGCPGSWPGTGATRAEPGGGCGPLRRRSGPAYQRPWTRCMKSYG